MDDKNNNKFRPKNVRTKKTIEDFSKNVPTTNKWKVIQSFFSFVLHT